MAEEERRELASKVYYAIDDILPDTGIVNYDRDEDDLCFHFTVNGDDIPMRFILRVIPSAGLISLISPFTFSIKEKNIIDTAIAVTTINFYLLNGSFDLNMSGGEVCFRINTCYTDENIDPDMLGYLIGVSSSTVDKYNDHILALNKNVISLEEFLEWVRKVNE